MKLLGIGDTINVGEDRGTVVGIEADWCWSKCENSQRPVMVKVEIISTGNCVYVSGDMVEKALDKTE